MNEKEMIIHLFELAGFQREITSNFDGWVFIHGTSKQGWAEPDTYKEAVEIVQRASHKIGFGECRKRASVIFSTDLLKEDL